MKHFLADVIALGGLFDLPTGVLATVEPGCATLWPRESCGSLLLNSSSTAIHSPTVSEEAKSGVQP